MNTKQTNKSADRSRLDEIRKLVGEVRSVEDGKRVMAVALKVLARLSSSEIAYLLQIEPQSVRNINCKYARKGTVAIAGRSGRGGRHRMNLTLKQEQDLLWRSCVENPATGRPVVDVKILKSKYRRTILRKQYRKAESGKPSRRAAEIRRYNSSLYRLLERHKCKRICREMYTPPEFLE